MEAVTGFNAEFVKPCSVGSLKARAGARKALVIILEDANAV